MTSKHLYQHSMLPWHCSNNILKKWWKTMVGRQCYHTWHSCLACICLTAADIRIKTGSMDFFFLNLLLHITKKSWSQISGMRLRWQNIKHRKSFIYLHKSTPLENAKQLEHNRVRLNSLGHVSVSAVSHSGWTGATEWLLPDSCILNVTVSPEVGYSQRKKMRKVY